MIRIRMKYICKQNEAYHYRSFALGMNITTGNTTEAVCYGCLGSVFQSINNMMKAKEYHEKALAITIEISH